MKQYTDFSDLATRSVLGSEGITRQVQPVIESPITRRQARNLQDQERVQAPAQHREYIEMTTVRQLPSNRDQDAKSTGVAIRSRHIRFHGLR
jgi:hypothetical protein